MNRSNKGFGLAGVLVTVILLIVAAIFSASAKSSTLSEISDCPQFSNICELEQGKKQA